MAGPKSELKDHRDPARRRRTSGAGAGCRFRPTRTRPTTTSGSSSSSRPRGRRSSWPRTRRRRGRSSLPRRSRPTRRVKCAAEVVAADKLAAVDWDQVALLSWQAPLPERGRGQAGPGVRRPRRPGDLLPAARRPAGASFGRPLDVLGRPDAGGPGRELAGRSGPAGPDRRAARRLPVGQLQVRKYCGLSGEFTPLATLRGGAPLLARADDRARAASTSARPRRPSAIRRWRPTASCSTCWCSGRWPRGRRRWAAPGSSSAGDAGRRATRRAGSGWRAPRRRSRPTTRFTAASTRRASGCWRSTARPPRTSRRCWPTTASPSCSAGSISRGSTTRPGSISSLIQEIWRLFLVAMMVAMVVEAGLCLPKPARPREAAA